MIPPCPSGTACCSSQDLTQGTDMLFWAERDVDPHCYVRSFLQSLQCLAVRALVRIRIGIARCTQVATYQYTSGNSTFQTLTRSFSNDTCLTTCDSYQSLPALAGSSSLNVTLNYFRCYTFEGGNYDDVSNAGSSTNIVCKSTSALLSLPLLPLDRASTVQYPVQYGTS